MRSRMKTLLALLPGYIVFALAWLYAALGGGAMAAPSFFQNPDALVRLERIRQWLDGGDWFASHLARVGAVDHLVLHWTRPLDVLVATLALALKPFVGLTDAVLYAGVWASLPMGLVALSLGAHLVRVCGVKSLGSLGLAAVFLALSAFLHLAFRPQMWPDHHGLMIVLCFAAVLLAHRMLAQHNVRAAWALGGVQALALWVSPESLVLVGGLNASYAVLWILRGEVFVVRLAVHAAGALSLGLVFALLIEYGAFNAGGALDRLSTFSFAIAFVLGAVWLAVMITRSRFTTALRRGVSGAAFAGLGVWLLVTMNPNALRGPMAATDPWFLNTWAAVYSDGFSMPVWGALVLSLVALAGGAVLAFHREEARLGYVLLAPLVLVFGGLGVMSSARWVIYGEGLDTALIVAAFGLLWSRLAVLLGVQGSALRVLAPVVLMALALIDVAAISVDDGKIDAARRTAKKACNLDAAIAQLNRIAADRGPMFVVAHANMTPAILY